MTAGCSPFSVPGAGCCPGYWPSDEAPLPGFEFTPHSVQPEQVICILSEHSFPILEIRQQSFSQGCWECEEVVFLEFHTLLSVISSVAKYFLPPLPSPPPPPPQVLMGLEKTCLLFYPYSVARDAPCSPELCINPVTQSGLSFKGWMACTLLRALCLFLPATSELEVFLRICLNAFMSHSP